MELINLEGLTVVGQGSEWFWAAAQFVVVVVSLYAIYRQLQAQAASNALARLDSLVDRWDSKLMVTARLETAIALRDAGLGSMPRLPVVALQFLAFFEILGDLRRQGHISTRDIADTWFGTLVVWWRLIGPAIEGTRTFEGDRTIWGSLEVLYNDTLALVRHDGGGPTVVTRPLPELLDQVIANLTEQLRLRQAVDGNVMPTSTPAASGSQPAVT